jgi:hypothetical protein
MFGSENVQVATLVINSDPGGTDEIFYLMKAPRALTVLAAYAVSEQTQNAGTAIQARLENWGANGTAVEGTISAYLGGTASADRLTARVPATATIAAAQDNVDQGDWLVVRYGEEGSGWISGDRLQYIVQFVNGLGA